MAKAPLKESVQFTPTGLTLRQERFAVQYARHGNATRAVHEAGYNCNSDNTAAALASKDLLNNPKIVDRITQLLRERAAVEEVTEQWLLGKLKANVENAAVAGQFAPSNRAIEMLGRQLYDMFVDTKQLEISGQVEHRHAVLRDYLLSLPLEDQRALSEGNIDVLEGDFEDIEEGNDAVPGSSEEE